MTDQKAPEERAEQVDLSADAITPEDIERQVTPMAPEPEPLRTPSGQIMSQVDVAERAMHDEAFDLKGKDAMALRLRLDQIVNGMDSLLTQMQQRDQRSVELRDQLNKALERLEKLERASASWAKDREKWVEFTKEQSAGVPDEVRKEAQAKARQELGEAVKVTKARVAHNARSVREYLAQFPTETIVSPGKYVLTTVRGQPSYKLMPERVGYKGIQFSIPIGRPFECPKPIADILRSRRQTEQETEERKKILSYSDGLGSDKKIAKEWAAIDERYQAPTAAGGFPVG